jgi:putative addiction module killer protein
MVMVSIRRTEFFHAWLTGLKDERAKAKIAVRIDRLALGNAGDVKPAGHGISKLRIDYGPGYRVYFRRRADIITLLVGGDKDTQDKDIKAARAMADELEE